MNLNRITLLIIFTLIFTSFTNNSFSQDNEEQKKKKRKALVINANGNIVDGSKCRGLELSQLDVTVANLNRIGNQISSNTYSLPEYIDSLYVAIKFQGEIVWTSDLLDEFTIDPSNDNLFHKYFMLQDISICNFENSSDTILNVEVCFVDNNGNNYFDDEIFTNLVSINNLFEGTLIDSFSNCFNYKVCCPANNIRFAQSKKLEVYPNPFNTYLILVNNSDDSISVNSLLDVNGNRYSVNSHYLNNEIRKITVEPHKTIPSGLYFIDITISGKPHLIPIYKLNNPLR